MEEEAKNPVMISRALFMLSSFGVIDSPRDPRISIEGFAEEAEQLLGSNAQRIRIMVRNRLVNWVERHKLNPCLSFLKTISKDEYFINDDLLLSSIISDINYETSGELLSTEKSGFLEKIAGPERIEPVCFIIDTMQELIRGNKEKINAVYKASPPVSDSNPLFKAQILINLACFNLGMRDNNAGLDNIKKAIFICQEKNSLCFPQAYRIFSLVSMSRQKMNETVDYLDFAMINAKKTGNYRELGISSYYASVVQYILGNLSKAAQLARKACDYSVSAGSPGWALRSCFFEGRLSFEAGRYKEALGIFTTLSEDPYVSLSPESEKLLAAWIYRTRIYSGDFKCQKPLTGGFDADLFETEAAYFSGDYQKCAELAKSLGNPFSEDYIYTEQPDWRSGYAQCENLFFSGIEHWDRIKSVYLSLALSRLSANDRNEAIDNMQQLLHNERVSEMDPNDAFYYFSWFKILEHTNRETAGYSFHGTEQVDLNTAVNMALKRLLQRAARIEEFETRNDYLSSNYWNSKITRVAKEYKLL